MLKNTPLFCTQAPSKFFPSSSALGYQATVILKEIISTAEKEAKQYFSPTSKSNFSSSTHHQKIGSLQPSTDPSSDLPTQHTGSTVEAAARGSNGHMNGYGDGAEAETSTSLTTSTTTNSPDTNNDQSRGPIATAGVISVPTVTPTHSIPGSFSGETPKSSLQSSSEAELLASIISASHLEPVAASCQEEFAGNEEYGATVDAERNNAEVSEATDTPSTMTSNGGGSMKERPHSPTTHDLLAEEEQFFSRADGPKGGWEDTIETAEDGLAYTFSNVTAGSTSPVSKKRASYLRKVSKYHQFLLNVKLAESRGYCEPPSDPAHYLSKHKAAEPYWQVHVSLHPDERPSLFIRNISATMCDANNQAAILSWVLTSFLF